MILGAVSGAILALLVGIYITTRGAAVDAAVERIDRERTEVARRIAGLHATRALRPVFWGSPEEGNSWELIETVLEPLGPLASADPGTRDRLKRGLARSWTEPSLDYGWESDPRVFKAFKACEQLVTLAKASYEAGRTGEAVEYLIMIWGLADRIGVKQSADQFFWRFHSADEGLKCLRDFLSDGRLTGSDLVRVATALETFHANGPDLLESFQILDCKVRKAVLDTLDRAVRIPEFADLCPEIRNKFSIHIEAARLLQIQDKFMGGVERILQLPRIERSRSFHRLHLGLFQDYTALDMKYLLLTDSILGTEGRHAVDLSLARLAISIARYHEDRGRFPAGLADLNPDYLSNIPQDALLSVPFGYLESGKVYAFGFNGVDDGGAEDPAEGGDGDIVWTVQRRSAVK